MTSRNHSLIFTHKMRFGDRFLQFVVNCICKPSSRVCNLLQSPGSLCKCFLLHRPHKVSRSRIQNGAGYFKTHFDACCITHCIHSFTKIQIMCVYSWTWCFWGEQEDRICGGPWVHGLVLGTRVANSSEKDHFSAPMWSEILREKMLKKELCRES